MKNRNKKYFAFKKKISNTAYFIAGQMCCPLGIIKKYEYRKAKAWIEKLSVRYQDIAEKIIDRVLTEYHSEGECGYSAYDMDNAMLYGTRN